MSDVRRILDRVEQGDPQAADELLPLIYEERHHGGGVVLGKPNPICLLPGHEHQDAEVHDH